MSHNCNRGAEYLGQASEGHFVGVAVRGYSLEVEDEEGKGVLVGSGELSNGLKGRCETILLVRTLWMTQENS